MHEKNIYIYFLTRIKNESIMINVRPASQLVACLYVAKSLTL